MKLNSKISFIKHAQKSSRILKMF